MILVDAGPLIALLHAGDQNHERCVEALRRLREPMATAWPVVTEAMHLLGFSWDAQDALWEMLSTDHLGVLPLEARDGLRMRELMRKYRDLPMDIADASLVTLAEREGLRRVFTTDRRDFSVYRLGRSGRFSIVP
ncbi:MAG: PIN domain-containing protein [Candidatus Rokubacteria bacterium]|nr:PIN domain-containing protein [Candidatus Rokubacteria bacterium]